MNSLDRLESWLSRHSKVVDLVWVVAVVSVVIAVLT